jgi:hypothetical protein
MRWASGHPKLNGFSLERNRRCLVLLSEALSEVEGDCDLESGRDGTNLSPVTRIAITGDNPPAVDLIEKCETTNPSPPRSLLFSDPRP